MLTREETEQKRSGMSRRDFLKAAFAGIVLVSGGTVWKAVDQGVVSAGKGPAYQAWKDWNRADTELDHPLPLIRAAILAASAHNAQPWLFRINGDTIDLYADVSRNLGAMDMLLREMHISLGCALENLSLAAQASGYHAEIILLPGEADNIHVARITLVAAAAQVSELYEAIPQRHTNRSAYDTRRALPDDLDHSLRQLIADIPEIELLWIGDEQQRLRMGEMIVDATEAITRDKEQSKDSHRWYRHDWDELQTLKDGTTLDATGSSPLTRAIGKLLPVSEETSNRYWLKATKETQVPTAAAFACLLVTDRSRNNLLQVGRACQRIHLWAVTKGIALQPLNQPNERIDRELAIGLSPVFGDRMQDFIPESSHKHSVFTMRIGYADSEALKSPRRPVEEVIWRTAGAIRA